MVRRLRSLRPLTAGLGLSLCVSASVAWAQSALPRGAPPVGSGPIQVDDFVRAVQGDTLDASIGGARVGIGIVGIRAPQGNTPCGREATALLQDLVAGGIRLDEEPGLPLGPRSRRMYHVTTADGRSVAEVLVAAGLARADGEGGHRERLAELETAARTGRRGCLWSTGGAR